MENNRQNAGSLIETDLAPAIDLQQVQDGRSFKYNQSSGVEDSCIDGNNILYMLSYVCYEF